MFILQNFILFTVYSFLGWVSETVYCFIIDKKYVNRGFLVGPFCPIYGFGAVLVLNLLNKYNDDLIALFVMSIVVTGFVEYITSYVLEKSFNISLWNYSNHKFNLNGRVCLWNLILFGILSLALVHIINPFVISVLRDLPRWSYIAILLVMIPYFLTDLVIASKAMKEIRLMVAGDMLDLAQLTSIRDDVREEIRTEVEERRALGLQRLHKRLIRAFPNMEVNEFPDAIRNIRKELRKK